VSYGSGVELRLRYAFGSGGHSGRVETGADRTVRMAAAAAGDRTEAACVRKYGSECAFLLRGGGPSGEGDDFG